MMTLKPKMQETMNDHRLPRGVQVIERGWLSANMVVSTGRHNSAVIDSGYCTHSDQTLALTKAALNGESLDILLNTHLHSDHCGGNAALQAFYPDLQTFIPPGHASCVANWDPVLLSHQSTGQLCPQFSFQGLLSPGSEILLGDNSWQVHAAAGHDPHSVILFEPVSKCLISADALWENGFGVVFPELDGDDAFDEVSITLDLIENLNPRTVVPGHGRVFDYSESILSRSRQRLEAFISNPTKHARHAVKVLLKFKLLEVRQQNFSEFLAWALETPYFDRVRVRFFASIPLAKWVHDITLELVNTGSARFDGSDIINT